MRVTHISVTASPTPQNLASSSMPSSLMTVLSTSKHTASARRKSSFVCERVVIVLQRPNGTAWRTHRQKHRTGTGGPCSSGCFGPVNEAPKATDASRAVKHQMSPFTKTAACKRFAHTRSSSPLKKNASRCSHVGGGDQLT